MFEFHFFNGKYDNEVKPAQFYTWEQLCKLFSFHAITPNKNRRGFVAAKFKTENYKPAELKQYNKDGEIVSITTKMRNGVPIVGRYAENIISYNCLVFDYDGNGVDIYKKIDEFKDFRYIGYTSHNHMISGVHKFRLIFPFADECPIEEWRKREEAFKFFGGTDDNSTTAKARIFFAPSCPKEGVPYKMAWNNEGEILDWRVFPEKKVTVSAPVSITPTSNAGTGKVRFDTLNMVQFFKDKGLYVKDCGNGKHDVRCFREHEHVTKSVGGTVVWQLPGKWPSFYCGHSHNLTSKHFWEHYKKDELAHYCEREVISSNELLNKYRIK